MRFLPSFLVPLLFLITPAFSHSGGFDDDGCHKNRATGDYHCHHSEAVAQYYRQQHADGGNWYRAEVLKVTDGDSFRVRARIWLDHLVETNIRVRGIDTPEIKRAGCAFEKQMGRDAREKLTSLLSGGVILHNVEFDKYGGRGVADVYTTDFKNIGLTMINDGLAKFYNGRGARPEWCS